MGPDVPSGLRVPEYVEKRYLPQTRLLDFGSPGIHDLVAARGWGALEPFDQIGKAYTFVRDEIAFGYNRDDEIAASEVLKDGYGQCNTKGTLLMALLRALGIACRLHGFTIHKELQRGVVPELVYGLAPDDILHSWVEVWHDGRWINLEGFILDQPFLDPCRQSLPEPPTNSAATAPEPIACPRHPLIGWDRTRTSNARASMPISGYSTARTTSTPGISKISAGCGGYSIGISCVTR